MSKVKTDYENNKKRVISLECRKEQFDKLQILKKYQGDDEGLVDNLLITSHYSTNKFKFQMLLQRLPFSLRLFIIDHISVKATRFFFDQQKYEENQTSKKNIPYLYSYETRSYITMSYYIRLLYGYNISDPKRMIYLVFGYLVFRGNKQFLYVPQKHLRQLYMLNGKLSKKYMISKLTDNCESVCFSDLEINSDSMLSVIMKMKKLKKFAVQRIHNIWNSEIMEALHSCEIVRIMDCGLNDKDCKSLVSSPKLKNLNLNNNFDITSKGFSTMNKHNTIVHLRINNTSVDDTIREYVLQNHSLREIQISHTNVSSNFVWYVLCNHPHVHTIELMDINKIQLDQKKINRVSKKLSKRMPFEKLFLDCTRIDMNTLMACSAFPNLKQLSLFNTGCTDEVAEYILNSYKQVTRLNLGYNGLLTDVTIHRLCETNKIEVLEYTHNNLDNDSLGILFSKGKFRQLSIEGSNITDRAFLALRDNNTLETLKIVGENENITDVGIEYVKNCSNVMEIIGGTDERPVFWNRTDPREEVFFKLGSYKDALDEKIVDFI